MGENRGQAGLPKVQQQPLEREIDVVGQLDQNVAAMVGRRDDLPVADPRQQVRLDPHVRPGQHLQRQRRWSKRFLQPGRCLADGVARVPRVVAQLVRRGDDRANAVGQGHFGHRQRLVHRGRAVIEPRQQVAMDIDHRLASGSSFHRVESSLKGFAQPVLDSLVARRPLQAPPQAAARPRRTVLG